MVRLVLVAAPCVPLACAVATEPELTDTDGGGSAGLAGAKAGSPPILGTAGTPGNAFGGTSSMPSGGAGSTAGTSAAAGKAGGTSGGGKASAGAGGQAGMSSGGANHGGGGAGGASGGKGGAPSNGCGTLKAWKGGDSTLTIAAGEVVQWMGKRYKATASIAYPNTECAPDMPAMWCATWFTPDGDC